MTISGLTNGQPYYVKIRAVNGLGFGPDSNVWSTTTTPRTTPDAPTITSVTRGYRRLTVAFTAPAFNGGSAITGYEYSTNGGTTFTSMGQITTADYAITGLPDFTSYDVRVRAMNVAPGVGTRSNLVSAYTAGVPGTVTGVSGTSNANATSLVSWTAPDANGDGIDDYTIQYSTTSDFSSDINTFAHTASAAVSQPIPLTNGTTYYFRVKAVNAVGSSANWSAISAGARPAAIAGIPTSITQSSGNGTYIIGWTAPSGTAPFKYVVQITTDDDINAWATSTANPIRLIWDATGTSYTFTGLTNSKAYKARVYAYNDAGATSPYWAESTAQTPSTVPDNVATPTSSAGDRFFKIDWVAPATGGTPITTYWAQYSTNNVDWVGTVDVGNVLTQKWTSNGTTFKNDGTTYYGRVIAFNVRGHSVAWSAGSTGRAPAMVIPTMNWDDSSATRYSHWQMSWVGTTGYTYQPQKHYSSWEDFGLVYSGAGTDVKTSSSFSVGYGGTVYGRVKVTDPDGVVGHTNQRYVTAGRAAGSDADTYSWNDWTYATGSNSGTVLFDDTQTGGTYDFNGANSGNVYPISYPHVYDNNESGTLNSVNGDIVYVYAVKIRMARNNGAIFDLTTSTQTNTTGRKVFFYGPGGLGMRLWKQTDGIPVGQSWGTPDQTSNTKWTGTPAQEHTWNVDSTVAGNVLVNGTRALQAPGNEWILSGSNAAGNVYSTTWGNASTSAATNVTLTVFYIRARRTTLTTTHPYAATNSVYG